MKSLLEVEYEDIFSPETMALLKDKSGQSLRQMLGDKNLQQVMRRSTELLPEIIDAEDGYRDALDDEVPQWPLRRHWRGPRRQRPQPR